MGIQQCISFHCYSTDQWLSHLFTGAMSQTVVTQESSLTVSPKETVTLTCGSSAGPVTTYNYAKWIQEKPHQVYNGLIGDTSNRVPGVPARFSGSLLEDKAALTITGAQTEDEAVYYCALWYSNHIHSGTCRWGSRTQTSWYNFITALFSQYDCISLGSRCLLSIAVKEVIKALV